MKTIKRKKYRSSRYDSRKKEEIKEIEVIKRL